MNYGTIKDINAYITSAALAPKPTLKQRFVMLIKSSRPPGWTFGPILYGIGTIHSGAIPNTLGALAISAVQIVTLSFPLCIVVFGINDIYDYASDVLNPRKSITSLEGTILPPAHHPFVRRAAIISSGVVVATSTLPAFYGSSLVSWNSVIPVASTAALVALGWAYSAPPTRLKEIPIIDSISNGVIVWIGLLVGYSSCRTLADLPWGFADIPLKGYAVGLVTASVHAIGAAADIDADVASGQRTIATLVGRRGCAAFGVAAYAISLVIEDKIPETIFRIYLIGGLLANFSACLYPSPTGVHRAFQAIVWWTVIMAVIWFGAQVAGMLNL